MNRNIIIGVIVVIFVVGAFLIFRSGEIIDVSVFDQDEAELNQLGTDIDAFSQDNSVLDEIDQTFDDLTDAGGALSIEAIDQEAAEADLSETLDAFAADEVISDEIDQTLGEVSQ